MSENLCHKEQIAAYIDGELDECALAIFERHLLECAACRAALSAHRRFVCELDAAIAHAPEVTAPADFARMVRVHAESDMRGLRNLTEHKRALRFSVILALFAFALLGTSSGFVSSSRVMVTKILDLSLLLGKAVYDSASSVAIVSRVLSRKFILESGLSGLIVVLFGLAVLLLSRLISDYHRARTID